MKKNSVKNLIAVIFVFLAYIITSIFSLGTANLPSEIYAWKTDGNPNGVAGQNSYANVDLTSDQNDIANIYVFIGDVYSYDTDKDGNAFITVYFDFKTKSGTSGASTSYTRRETVKVPVVYGSGGYKFIKVFDASKDSEGEISEQRVKINTPNKFNFHEVVFTDKDGKVLQTEIGISDENERVRARLLIDEQNAFTTSVAKKYVMTDRELQSVYSARGFLEGEKTTVVDGPLTLLINSIGIKLFGKNTFGIRFFNFVGGFVILILTYALTVKLFGKTGYGVFASLFALAIGSVFSLSTFGFGAFGVLFALLVFYFAWDYFINRYYGEGSKPSIFTLIISGLFFGLSVSADMRYFIIVLGLAVIFAFAYIRAKKQYKKEDKDAVGLEKEDLFLEFRRKRIVSVLTAIASFVILPTVVFTVVYAVVSKGYNLYFNGFFKGAVGYTKLALTSTYSVNPFALFVGFGGQNYNGYYSFLNYFTTILGLLSFIFVSVAVIFGKKIKIFNNIPNSQNKYKMITVAFLSFALTVLLGYNSSVIGFAGVSVFYAIYIVFAYHLLRSVINKKAVCIALDVSAIISAVIFVMAFFGYTGIVLPEVVNKILYLWQVL